jgi:hypothetical protein
VPEQPEEAARGPNGGRTPIRRPLQRYATCLPDARETSCSRSVEENDAGISVMLVVVGNGLSSNVWVFVYL